MNIGKRTAQALALKSQGLSYKEIANQMGISRDGAYQLCYEGKRRLDYCERTPRPWDAGISVRLANALNNAGIESKEEAIALFPKLWPWRKAGCLNPVNYGRKCHLELARLLGMPEPKSTGLICKHCGKPANGK